jgi:hypothetical protein
LRRSFESLLFGYWQLETAVRAKGQCPKASPKPDPDSANDLTRSTVLSQARACFADALAIAQQQGARTWKLRAALSMHHLDMILGNAPDTRLAEICSSFTEGYETADLRQARAFLGIASLK